MYARDYASSVSSFEVPKEFVFMLGKNASYPFQSRAVVTSCKRKCKNASHPPSANGAASDPSTRKSRNGSALHKNRGLDCIIK